MKLFNYAPQELKLYLDVELTQVTSPKMKIQQVHIATPSAKVSKAMFNVSYAI